MASSPFTVLSIPGIAAASKLTASLAKSSSIQTSFFPALQSSTYLLPISCVVMGHLRAMIVRDDQESGDIRRRPCPRIGPDLGTWRLVPQRAPVWRRVPQVPVSRAETVLASGRAHH